MEASQETAQTEAPAESQETPGAENVETASQDTPDISEQLAAINQRLETLGPQQPEEPSEIGNQDLYDLLTGEDEYEGEEGQPEGANLEPATDGAESRDEAVQAFNDAVRERVAEEVAPFIEGFEMERREGAIDKLANDYPDLRKPEVAKGIASHLDNLATQYDNPYLRSDPALVELAIKAYRADQASASEVPAEQARSQGAALETGTGAGADGQVAPEDQIKQAILGAGGGNPHF